MSDNHKKGERRKFYTSKSIEVYNKRRRKMPTYARKRNYNLKLCGRKPLETLIAKNANKAGKTALRMQVRREICFELFNYH